MKKQINTCYMCSSVAETKEHVPPKCFFPQDLNSTYRKNLIKVPSCRVHNNDTSDTDEIVNTLIYLAAGNVKNKALIAKGKKILDFNSEHGERKSVNIIKILKNNPRIMDLEDRFLGKKGQTLIFDYLPFQGKLRSTFEKISCGIYYYKTGKKLDAKHNVIDIIGINSNYVENVVNIKIKQDMISNFEKLGINFEGENPEVFKYRFFYNGSSVFFHFELFESINIFNQAILGYNTLINK